MERLQELFRLYYNKTASPEQTAELMQLIATAPAEQLGSLIKENGESLGVTNYSLPSDKVEAILQHILAWPSNPLLKERVVESPVVPLHPPKKFFNTRRIAVAASIIMMLGIGSYFIFFNKKSDKPPEIVKTSEPVDVKAPETNRAMVILANGQRVYLDSVSNGQLAVQGNIKLVKLANGQIAYQSVTGEIVTEVKYNTLENPRGSKIIDMQLSDGSHVWLNAGSSVTYPVAFLGSERKVSITGEAYFEVAHNATMPFKVSKGSMTVEVLGTHFNVNAYDDEQEIKVTLLEGSVRTSNSKGAVILKPGQQARITSNQQPVTNNQVDIEQVMAWKNGRFEFNGAGLEEMMRQISRWYDVEVVYEARANDLHFTGGTSRDSEVSKILMKIETTEAIHFRIEGKKVFVIK